MAETINKRSDVLTPDKPVTLPLLKTKEKKQHGKGAGRIVLATALTLTGVEGVGAVITELTNDQPASVRTILPDLVWPYTMVKDWLHKETPVPPNFDPDAKEGTIGAGINTITVSKEALKNAYEEQVLKNKDTGRPTVLFPAIFTASGQRIAYEYQKPFSPFSDGTLIERPGTIHAQFDKDEVIIVPAENAEVFQFQHVVINGNDHFVGLWIKFQQNGETYAFGISGADVRTLIPIGEATNAPFVPTNEAGTLLLYQAKDGLKLPFGTHVARVNIKTNLELGFSFSKFNAQTSKWDSIKPNFTINSSEGTAKLPMTPTTQ